MLTVKLYTYAGVYIKDLTAAEGISIRAARDQEIRRSCSFTLAVTSQDLADVRIPGRRVKVYDSGSTVRFSGYIDSVRPSIADSAWMEVSCRDKAKVLKLARFPADVTYDYATTNVARTLNLAEASTELQAGDEIQRQGKVYGRRLQATVRGITSDVEPDSESGSILDGSYVANYSADGLTLLTLTQYVDLLASESISGITATPTAGTVLVSDARYYLPRHYRFPGLRSVWFSSYREATDTAAAYYSTDGLTWTAYTSGTVIGRYLKIVTTRTAGPIAVSLVVTAGTTSPAVNVLTDNAASWRPRPTDMLRELTVHNSTALDAVNYLIVKAGVSDLDRETAYIVDGYALISGTWTKIITDALLVGGYNELLFDSAYEGSLNASQFRLCFKRKTAPVAVRYVEARYTSSLASVYWLIRAVLTAAGETDVTQLTVTHQIPQGNAITFEAGEEKLRACIDLAETAGYEFFYDEQDRPVLRPKRWADPMDADIPTYDAHLEWAPEYSDANLYNQVLVAYEAADASLSGVATNDRGDSGTSTVNIGARTSPVLRFPLANTQAKLDQIAQEQLARYSKAETRATLRLPWAVGDVLPEPGGIVRVVESRTGTDELMRVVSVELREANEVTLQLEVETL